MFLTRWCIRAAARLDDGRAIQTDSAVSIVSGPLSPASNHGRRSVAGTSCVADRFGERFVRKALNSLETFSMLL